MDKLKVGIFGFTGCAGDQLVIIHDEDRLLDYFKHADIRSFVMASSLHDDTCELDISFVEGAIHTREEVEELKEIRSRSKILIAIGTCAVHGGIQSGMNSDNLWKQRYENVYGDLIMHTPAYEPKPLHHYIHVDMQISGCPITKDQIYHVFSKLINNNLPQLIHRPVCDSCKTLENICLLDKGELCLGPITLSGCNAACPSNNVICKGCYGLYPEANLRSFIEKGLELGFNQKEIVRKMTVHGGQTMIDKLIDLEVYP
ncbi:MAG: NADH:ubiquinone oxidoreductase [Candidatus Heimdallarchaeota archaeon]|nr:NADH:ubiquinone oxidoreductase [Candidatus Heimdallarchaeota archaeon]